MAKNSRLAGIEYAGVPGISKECQEAVMRLIQFGDRITHTRILTHAKSRTSPAQHCLLLTYNLGDVIAIRSGFSSGYGGGGPWAFSYTLQMLDSHGSEIEEYLVSEELVSRVDTGSVRASDLATLQKASPVRPTRWPEYIDEIHSRRAEIGTLWAHFPQ